ncbi:DUF3443 family protein [Bdellovibrio svalbardensis]|uniref:DUF3443 domain-containing protein n=1 Tax=Bdellovibrio svalbardensis TaxID=2972972 RepID=A0ABT6DKM7_9BACT|nr:DUF3443 family protein [Bdellovibrio svalbardensis]MDG0817410.1 DUF3443 domain-containing protein [Bdellovibrio svalbardensis]
MNKLLLLMVGFHILAGCSGGGGGGADAAGAGDPFPDGAAAYSPVMSGNNVLPLQVTTAGYLNEPVVSVVICNPGTNGTGSCVTVNNILLDTGSSGLRVFNSKLTGLNLTQVTNVGGNQLANCTKYADGTAHWGPVKTADVVLGGEIVSSVNIQVLNDQYADATPCGTPEVDNGSAGYNGILGVGIRDQDCGANCVATTVNGKYYSCAGSSNGSACTDSLATLAMQVRNPVAAITAASNSDGIADNNGTVLILPSVPSTGAVTASGYLIFGINTRANNTPAGGTKVIATDSQGLFVTNFNGQNLTSFIDSGSNGLFFPKTSSTPLCYGDWYCPSSTLTLQATHKPFGGGTSYAVTFEVANAGSIFSSNNYALSNLSAVFTGYFDWGLGFFYGRSVYTSINGKGASVNGVSAPFYAY